MTYLTTNNEMKQLEQFSATHNVSLWNLMLNAGTAAGKKIKQIAKKHSLNKILFLAGKGNNAGDAWVAAKYLRKKGFSVFIYNVMGLPTTELAKQAMDESDVAPAAQLPESCEIVVDAVFGTGFHGELPQNIADIFNKIKANIKIALDIPSGGNGTNGTADKNTFKADYTLTFGYAKTGLYQYPLKEYCGKTIVCPIGFSMTTESAFKKSNPYKIFSSDEIAKILPERKAESNKGTFGKLLCVTGSEKMPGACAMSTLAALRCGAGLVETATPKDNIKVLSSRIYEPVWIPLETDDDGFDLFSQKNYSQLTEKLKSATAVLVGCGLGVTDETRTLVYWLIKNTTCPLILDADALNCIAGNADVLLKAKNKVILTPHPGEMSRLTGKSTAEIQNSRIDTADEFVKKYPNCILVLKGAGTVVASKNLRYINTTGNAGMARGGSGDVLAGIISSFTAQGIKPEYSAALGTYIHGLAGDIAAKKLTQYAMLPSDIINNLSNAFEYLIKVER